MQARISLPFGKINERVIHTFEQPILQFLTTHSHIICVTQKQINVIPLLSSKPLPFIKVDTRTIVKIEADKNNRLAILYSNRTLEIRSVYQVEKLRISYENVEYSEEDVRKGFPKLYFKDDEIFVLTTKKLEMLSIKVSQRKIYSDILIQMHGNNHIIQSLAFSSLINKQKVAILHFNNKISFSFIPISIAEIEKKNVTQIRILSTSKFYDSKIQGKYLIREYLVMVVDNTRLQVYNLISMKKLIEIQYATQIGSHIDLHTDLLDTFLLVTIYKPDKQVKTNILYRINAGCYYMPTENYFKQEEPFFDTSIQLSIKRPIYLLTGDYQAIYSSLNNCNSNSNEPSKKCCSLTAIYSREIQPPQVKKNVKKKGKPAPRPLQKTIQIVLMLLDITKAKVFTQQIESKQIDYIVRRQRPEWKQLHKWKEIVISYLQMDQQNAFKFGLGFQQKTREDTQYFRDTEQKMQKEEQQSIVKTIQDQKPPEYSDPYGKLRVSLEDAVQKFKQKKFEEFLYEGGQCDDQEAIQAEFVKFIKQVIGDQYLCHYFDEVYQIHLEKNKESKRAQEKKLNSKKQSKGTKSQKQLKPISSELKGQISQLETEPLPPKQKQNINRVVSSENLAKTDKIKDNQKYNKSKFSFPTESKFSSDESEKEHKMSQQREHDISDNDSDPNQLFDEMLEAIQKSINRGFSPFEEKLAKMQEKLDKYQEKHLGHLDKYSKSVQFECNYLNNIQSSIHGYCFEMMGQFSETIQSGVQDYWQKIEDLDRKGTQQRQKTIHEFGKYIDQQIRERQSIFDENRSTIENHLGHLRKAISSQTAKKTQIIVEKSNQKQNSEYNPYYNMQDEEIEEMQTQSFEQERMMSDYKNEMEAFSVLLSLLGNKSNDKKP